MKELERSKRQITQDKDYFEKEMKDLKDKLSNVKSDYRETQGQRKQAMEEFSELNDKLADARSQKMRLTRLVREKEEEIETGMTKLDSVRQDLRASEKSKRELNSQNEDLQATIHKETKLRTKAETQIQKLEDELKSFRTKKYSVTTANEKDLQIVG